MLIKSKFRPAWWLRNPHAQTIWAAKVMRTPTPKTFRERLITPDGDFVDLDWSDDRFTQKCFDSEIDNRHANAPGKGTTQQRHGAPYDSKNCNKGDKPAHNKTPIVVVFHGLTGSSASPYVRALIDGLNGMQYRTVVMNFRGCSGEPNLKGESYHSGHTKDISFVINTIKRRFPETAIAATGYSIGGNALLKYLATQPDNPLHHAISVCPPLQLSEGAKRMEKGLSQIYQNRLVGQLKSALDDKHQIRPQLRLDQLNYKQSRTFRQFDAAATVPLHGLSSVDEYYNTASTKEDLPYIETPTHILFARDDPFFTTACVPDRNAMSDKVEFELASHGGHVAFVEGWIPLCGTSWLKSRLCQLHRHYFDS